MIKRIIICLFLPAFTCCLSKERHAEKVSAICKIDHRNLVDFKIVSFFSDGTKLEKKDLDRYNVEVNSYGCAIIPKSSKSTLTVKSGSLGINLTQEEIPEGYSEIHLKNFLENFDTWISCGLDITPHEMALKFSSIPEGHIAFQSSDMEIHTINPNQYGCSVVPRKPGRIISGSMHAIVGEVDDVIDVSLREEYPLGFINVCSKYGKSDKAVAAIGNFLNESKCEKMAKRLGEIIPKGDTLFQNIGLENANALHDIPFEKLNLSFNPLYEIKGFNETLKQISLSQTHTIFIDSLPKDLDFVYIGANDNIENLEVLKDLKNLKHLRIRSLSGLREVIVPNSQLTQLALDGLNLDKTELDWSTIDMFSGIGLSYPELKDISSPVTNAIITFNDDAAMFVAKNPTIQTLTITQCPAKPDFGILSNNIIALAMQDSNLETLDGLKHLPNLESLKVSNTAVSDLNPLKDCHNIHTLNISDTNVTNLTPLKELEKLNAFIAKGLKIKTENCPTDARSQVIRDYCKGLK